MTRRAQLFGVIPSRPAHRGCGQLAAMPTSTSLLRRSRMPFRSSAPRLPVVLRAFHGLDKSAGIPPAIRPCTISGLRRVGRRTLHRVQNAQTARSAAAARRSAVRPAGAFAAIASTALAIWGQTASTASATLWSSLLMSFTISSVLSSSICVVRGLRCSVAILRKSTIFLSPICFKSGWFSP